jgi:hypothetical protein
MKNTNRIYPSIRALTWFYPFTDYISQKGEVIFKQYTKDNAGGYSDNWAGKGDRQ